VTSKVPRNVVVVCSDDDLGSLIVRFGDQEARSIGLALVLDEHDRLKGVMNHSDVVRALASGRSLSSPVGDAMTSEPVTAHWTASSAQILWAVRDQLVNRSDGNKDITRYVPLLDDEGRVVEVVDLLAMSAGFRRIRESVEVFGLGFVGLTLSVALASRGHQVTGLDISPEVVECLRNGEPHVHEPRLAGALRKALQSKNIRFLLSPDERHSRFKIIAVGTPVDSDGTISLEAISLVSEVVGKRLRSGDVVLLRSTVPVGTSDTFIRPILEAMSGLRAGRDFALAFCPERTTEGQAMKELSSLPQIVGGFTDGCTERATSFWQTLTDSVIRVESMEAAELVKLINNGFRDLSFAFANGVALCADQFNIDAKRLIDAANEGYPRNTIPGPSPGVGGYCLTKDPYLYAHNPGAIHGRLSKLGREVNDLAATYPLEHVRRFCERFELQLAGLSVLIVGLAFKGLPETNDTRGSVARSIADTLLALGARVRVYDTVLGSSGVGSEGYEFVDLLDGARSADCVMILNNHPANVRDGLVECFSDRRVLVFDGWSLLSREDIERNAGALYGTMGYLTPSPAL